MAKTLQDYLREILKHREENPGHGINCACMDAVAWEIKADIREVIEPVRPLAERPRQVEIDAMGSFVHVMRMVARYYGGW